MQKKKKKEKQKQNPKKAILRDYLHLVLLGEEYKTENQTQTNDFAQLNELTMYNSPYETVG